MSNRTQKQKGLNQWVSPYAHSPWALKNDVTPEDQQKQLPSEREVYSKNLSTRHKIWDKIHYNSKNETGFVIMYKQNWPKIDINTLPMLMINRPKIVSQQKKNASKLEWDYKSVGVP